MNNQRFSFLFYILAALTVLCVIPFMSSKPQYNIDSMTFCTMFSIDREGGIYTVTLLANDAESGKVGVYSGSSEKPETAFALASNACVRNIFFGTAELAVISKSALGGGIHDIASYVLSNEEIPLRTLTAVCDGKASKLMLEYGSDIYELFKSNQSGSRLSELVDSAYTENPYFPGEVKISNGHPVYYKERK